MHALGGVLGSWRPQRVVAALHLTTDAMCVCWGFMHGAPCRSAWDCGMSACGPSLTAFLGGCSHCCRAIKSMACAFVENLALSQKGVVWVCLLLFLAYSRPFRTLGAAGCSWIVGQLLRAMVS